LRAARPDWEVVPVASGLQAVRELSLRGCDVLVTDLQMPVMSGAALVLRTRQEFPHVPVIVHSTMVDLGAGTSVGVPVDVAVPKSRGAAALVDAIEHLERSRIHQAAS
jgi:CheY-like chemotaxis protein